MANQDTGISLDAMMGGTRQDSGTTGDDGERPSPGSQPGAKQEIKPVDPKLQELLQDPKINAVASQYDRIYEMYTLPQKATILARAIETKFNAVRQKMDDARREIGRYNQELFDFNRSPYRVETIKKPGNLVEDSSFAENNRLIVQRAQDYRLQFARYVTDHETRNEHAPEAYQRICTLLSGDIKSTVLSFIRDKYRMEPGVARGERRFSVPFPRRNPSEAPLTDDQKIEEGLDAFLRTPEVTSQILDVIGSGKTELSLEEVLPQEGPFVSTARAKEIWDKLILVFSSINWKSSDSHEQGTSGEKAGEFRQELIEDILRNNLLHARLHKTDTHLRTALSSTENANFRKALELYAEMGGFEQIVKASEYTTTVDAFEKRKKLPIAERLQSEPALAAFATANRNYRSYQQFIQHVEIKGYYGYKDREKLFDEIQGTIESLLYSPFTNKHIRVSPYGGSPYPQLDGQTGRFTYIDTSTGKITDINSAVCVAINKIALRDNPQLDARILKEFIPLRDSLIAVWVATGELSQKDGDQLRDELNRAVRERVREEAFPKTAVPIDMEKGKEAQLRILIETLVREFPAEQLSSIPVGEVAAYANRLETVRELINQLQKTIQETPAKSDSS